MSDNQWQDDPDLARKVVRKGLAALESASGVVKVRIGGLSVLSDAENQALAAFRSRIEAYAKLKAPKHPLCLGVFGPPGSGKSFAVNQILESMGHAARVINLSQLEGPGDLSSALAEIVRWSAGKTPVVFFDEFDSALAGSPLGWLQWLLAPMQDGVVVYHGHAIEMKRAVFVFAGGTADSFEEFPQAHGDYFRGAKGPDFISRLRGHLNVRGVNEWPYRQVRRATVLRLAIERVAPGLLDADRIIPQTRMTDGFIDQLLTVGRFVHGSRSVEALVEIATRPDSTAFTSANLPAPDVLANHVDAGPLAGLAIALSAGGDRREGDTGDYDQGLEDVWTPVATRLLELGAGLVYGGDLRPGGFTTRLAEASSRLPNPLRSHEGAPAIVPFAPPRPARVTCFRSATDSESPKTPAFDRIDFQPLPGLTEEEFAELDLPSTTNLNLFNPSAEPVSGWKTSRDWCMRLGLSLALFRLRAEVTRLADAHLVFGGREYGAKGRFPGVAEEVMLSLAAGAAVYICGGFGGGAHAVGRVLGLGDPWFSVPDCLRVEKHGSGAATLESAVKGWGSRFQLTHSEDLPLDYAGLVDFLRSHSVDGSRWPNNGLTAEENRSLFRATNADEIIHAVTTGLRRRFGNAR